MPCTLRRMPSVSAAALRVASLSQGFPPFMLASTAMRSNHGEFSTFTAVSAASAVGLPSRGSAVRTVRYNVVSSPHLIFTGAASSAAQKAGLFTNARRSFAGGTEEELAARTEEERKRSQAFLKRPVDGEGRNAPRARDVEDHLPTKKQLNEELPSAAELEKALREGNMDVYTTKLEGDEE
ncbi:hypothetical protein ABL78_5967 [Leptomonas seymouri]|uniref:Uncharacterized protein n=1 Tax=Leptomonas seymouri TaxID=5684 RepID=A0A0N0P477_LEPSE|nr:hypothetical protein ABL78_5967 [Leptomonas seymouri]|eukprot:KPI84976.1 hypothetical protein ABL78_5967 [Leptomonas seymouri]